MKYKNAIILTGKDILIVFICFFMFMFLSGGGTQNVLAAEDEVTITLDANGGEAVEPVVYKKIQSKIGILPETTRTGYVFNGWWTKNGGTSSSDSAWGGIVKFNDTSLPSSDTTYYARWTEDKAENNKQDTYFMVILIALYLVLGLLHIIMERLQTVRTRLHIIMEL